VAALHPLGIRDSPARTLATALLVAFLVHLPLTPFPFILRWLSAYLTGGDTSWDYQDDSVIIPISLVEDEPAPKPAPPVETTPAPATTEPKAAGRPHAEDRSRDAGVADAGEPEGGRTSVVADAGRRREAGVETLALVEAGEGDAGRGSVKDTLSLVGGLRNMAKKNANVSIVFWFSTMREHPLGGLVGGILACNPQWRDFMGDLIDPLQDLDGVVLYGPRMSETSKLTVLAQSRMDDAKLRGVLEQLGHKPGAGPVDAGAGTRAVRFFADHADRIAFTHPRNMIIVTPPEGVAQFPSQKESITLPAGHGQAMSMTMVTPWRPLRALGVKLPESLSEIRLNAFAMPDGSVKLQVEFDDQDAASAEAHAPEVTQQFHDAVSVAALAAGPFAPILVSSFNVEFVQQGNHLNAELQISRPLSAILLGWVRQRICPSSAFDGGGGPN